MLSYSYYILVIYIYLLDSFGNNVSVQPVGCEIPHFVWFNVNSLTPTLHQASRQETRRVVRMAGRKAK
jgi:hypothetical protein